MLNKKEVVEFLNSFDGVVVPRITLYYWEDNGVIPGPSYKTATGREVIYFPGRIMEICQLVFSKKGVDYSNREVRERLVKKYDSMKKEGRLDDVVVI